MDAHHKAYLLWMALLVFFLHFHKVLSDVELCAPTAFPLGWWTLLSYGFSVSHFLPISILFPPSYLFLLLRRNVFLQPEVQGLHLPPASLRPYFGLPQHEWGQPACGFWWCRIAGQVKCLSTASQQYKQRRKRNGHQAGCGPRRCIQ